MDETEHLKQVSNYIWYDLCKLTRSRFFNSN